MNCIHLEIDGISVAVHPLPASRVVSVQKIVARGRRTWAIDTKGRLCCDRPAELKSPLGFRCGNICSIREDDIVALGLLGVFPTERLLQLREDAIYARNYKSTLEWLEDCVNSLQESGISLGTGWRKKLESAAHAAAAKRRAQDREARAAKGKVRA